MARYWMAKARRRMERKGTTGALHREMGVPEGEKIPVARMEEEMAVLHKKAQKGKLSIGELRRSRRRSFAKAARK